MLGSRTTDRRSTPTAAKLSPAGNDDEVSLFAMRSQDRKQESRISALDANEAFSSPSLSINSPRALPTLPPSHSRGTWAMHDFTSSQFFVF